MTSREPIFNVPSPVFWTLAALIVIHVVMSLLPEEMWLQVMEALALVPARFQADGRVVDGHALTAVTSLVTHQWLHGDMAHLLLNGAWLLAFGTVVARRMSWPWFLAFGTMSGVAGGLMFLLMHLGEPSVMIGASGALAGYMGGAFRFMFSAIDEGGADAFRGDARRIPRMTVGELLRDRRGLSAVALWIGVNGASAVLAPLLTSGSGIAWEAHLGGFLFGLLAFGLFDQGRSQPAGADLDQRPPPPFP